VAKEQHTVQPVPTVAPHSVNPELMRSPLDSSPVLTHQSKSYPGGQPRLARTPSVSSQSSLDSSVSRQVNNRLAGHVALTVQHSNIKCLENGKEWGCSAGCAKIIVKHRFWIERRIAYGRMGEFAG
jgi:hypothetical protein